MRIRVLDHHPAMHPLLLAVAEHLPNSDNKERLTQKAMFPFQQRNVIMPRMHADLAKPVSTPGNVNIG